VTLPASLDERRWQPAHTHHHADNTAPHKTSQDGGRRWLQVGSGAWNGQRLWGGDLHEPLAFVALLSPSRGPSGVRVAGELPD
jgi:hypothetical protein